MCLSRTYLSRVWFLPHRCGKRYTLRQDIMLAHMRTYWLTQSECICAYDDEFPSCSNSLMICEPEKNLADKTGIAAVTAASLNFRADFERLTGDLPPGWCKSIVIVGDVLLTVTIQYFALPCSHHHWRINDEQFLQNKYYVDRKKCHYVWNGFADVRLQKEQTLKDGKTTFTQKTFLR